MSSSGTCTKGRLLVAVCLLGLGFGAGYVVSSPDAVKRLIHPRGKSQDGDPEAGVAWRTATGDAKSEKSIGSASGLDALGYAQGDTPASGVSGVAIRDLAHTCKGPSLYVSGHGPVARLINTDGELLHEWTLDLKQICPDAVDPKIEACRFFRCAHLFDDGSLLIVFDYRAMAKIDRDSKLIWKRCVPYHHDVDVGADGRIYALSRKDGFLRPPKQDVAILDDEIHVLSPDGELLDHFSVIDALADSEYRSFVMRLKDPRQMKNGDVFHTNSVRVIDGQAAGRSPFFKAGNILVSIRNLDAIAILDPTTRRMVFVVAGPWHAQHDASLLPNGNVLMFDNESLTFVDVDHPSRALEYDLLANRIVWSYDGAPDLRFCSHRCGTTQRLPNGNTLVAVTSEGRAFEVTSEGDVVWEFRSPHRAGAHSELVAGLFQMVRIVDPRQVAWLDR